MKKLLILVSAGVVSMPVCPVFADGIFDGEVGASGVLSRVDGNKAKYNEYRDITDGVYTNLRLKYTTDDYFLRLDASDIGYDTQKYRVDAEMYGTFKAYLNYSEIPHNFTFGAETFYSGAGTNNLTYKGPIPQISKWNSFDYQTKRDDYEVGFSVDKLKPFFFQLSSPHEEKTGTYPVGVATGTSISPGSSFVEVPMPIDYRTNALNMVAGYAKNPYFAALSFYYSQFDNANSLLYFDRPTGTGASFGNTFVQDAYSLPPDNESYKVAFKGSAKLPSNSQFSANLATGRATSDENVLLAGTSTLGPVFHGKVDTDNVDLVFMSNPIRLLNAKVYYKYDDRKNESDQLTLAGVTNDLIGYQKNKFGIDLGWNLPAKFKLDTNYSFVDTARQGTDIIPTTRDNTLSTELTYRGLDFMTPKIGYVWMQRYADHDQASPTDVEAYIWRYDVAPKTQTTLKASLDIFPVSDLDFNVGYKYIDTGYTNTLLGLQATRSNQINLDAGYTFGKLFKVNAYYDIELQDNYQFQRAFTGTNANPSTQNATNYNWGVEFKDNSYSWGIGSEIYIIPKKVSLLLQYDNVNSNGNADFTYLFAPALTNGLNNNNIDMGNYDDYRLSSYSIKIVYTPTPRYAFTLGYAYESYNYDNAQLANYLMIQGTNYLTGAYANQNYNAQIIFTAMEYKF
jgi:MtrB/PioB family decaheme-associated outer membrane protein